MEEYKKFDEQGLFSGNAQANAFQNDIFNLDALNKYYNNVISSGSISTTAVDSSTITTDSTGTGGSYDYENYSPKSSWLFDKNTDDRNEKLTSDYLESVKKIGYRVKETSNVKSNLIDLIGYSLYDVFSDFKFDIIYTKLFNSGYAYYDKTINLGGILLTSQDDQNIFICHNYQTESSVRSFLVFINNKDDDFVFKYRDEIKKIIRNSD